MRNMFMLLLLVINITAAAELSFKPQPDANVRLSIVNTSVNHDCAVVFFLSPGNFGAYQTRFILPEGVLLSEDQGECDYGAPDEPWAVLSVWSITGLEAMSQVQVVVSWDIDGEVYRAAATWPDRPNVVSRSLNLNIGSSIKTETSLHIIRIGNLP